MHVTLSRIYDTGEKIGRGNKEGFPTQKEKMQCFFNSCKEQITNSKIKKKTVKGIVFFFVFCLCFVGGGGVVGLEGDVDLFAFHSKMRIKRTF